MSLSEGMLAAEASLELLDSSAGLGLRRDTRRNRRRLLAAASQLVHEGEELTLQRVAELADIAIATAYRHFPSIQDLVYAYVLAVVEDFASFSDSSESRDEDLFAEVLNHWIQLIQAHGHLMVSHRSRRGFLERLHEEDRIITSIEKAWRKPLKQLMDAKVIDASLISQGLFLCNQLFDPRDVLDLIYEDKIDPENLAPYLMATFEGALRGWGSVAHAQGRT